jgi:hypothetical protein
MKAKTTAAPGVAPARYFAERLRDFGSAISSTGSGYSRMPGTKCSSGHGGKVSHGPGLRGRLGWTPRSRRGRCSGAQTWARWWPAAGGRTSARQQWRLPGCGDRCLRGCCLCAGQHARRDGRRLTRPGCRQRPVAGVPHRSGGRGSRPCAGRSAEAQLGSGQVTPLESCRPSPAAQLGRSPRDHVQLRRALAIVSRRTLGAGDGAVEIRHVQQPDGKRLHRAG